MEFPSEDQLDSSKTSISETTDIPTTSTLPISPKKPIQLGIVQSSSGSRPLPGNQSSSKKSRWDQAPEGGENEVESKDTNVQSNITEESNIKTLIKKFEDISGSSKLESNKPTDRTTGLSSSSGRVKLVRTNFTKPENPSNQADEAKNNPTISKLEEIDGSVSKTIETQEVVSVSSSKALQIISSTYDSPSDESSQEADPILRNENQAKIPSDSAYASLEKLPHDDDKKELEGNIEERLESTLCLNNEPESSEIKNTDAEENLFEEEVAVADSVPTDTVENVKESKVEGDESEVAGETSDAIAVVSNDLSNPEQDKEDKSGKESVEKQERKTCIGYLDEKQTINTISEELQDVQTQLQTIEIKEVLGSDTKTVNSSQNCRKDSGINFTAPTISNVNEIVNTDVIESSTEKDSAIEIVSHSKEEDDFVFVSHSDLEGYKENKESALSEKNSHTEPVELSHIIKPQSDEQSNLQLSIESEEKDSNLLEGIKKSQSLQEAGESDDPVKDDVNLSIVEAELSTEDSAHDKANIGNITEVYNDGVDAKMEQMFSENVDMNEDTPVLKDTIEEELTPITDESIKESEVLKDSKNDNEIKEDEPKTESSDSLLLMLESEISPAEIGNYEDHNRSLDLESSSEVDSVLSNVKEIMPEQSDSVTKELNVTEDKVKEQVSCDSEEVDNVLSNVKEIVPEPSDSVTKELDVTDKVKEQVTCESEEVDNVLSNVKEIVPEQSDSVTKELDVTGKVEEQVTCDSAEDGSKKYVDNEDTFPQPKKVIDHSNTSNIDDAEIISEDESSNQLFQANTDIKKSSEAGSDGDCEQSKILIEEIEDVQSSSDIKNEDCPQVLEKEPSENHAMVVEGCTDVLGSENLPETTTDVVIEDIDCTGSTTDSRTIVDIDSSEMLVATNEIDNENKSNSVKYLESAETTTIAILTENDALQKIDNIKITNSEDNNTLINESEAEDKKFSEIGLKYNDSEIHKPSLITDSENKGSDPNDNQKLKPESDLPTDSIEKSLLSGSNDSVSVSHPPVDLATTSGKKAGSIEVSQQETIERSIDMLFDVGPPSDDQPMKPTSLSSVSLTQEAVSSEEKKQFSEEIQKEMFNLSPEHSVQVGVESMDTTDSGKINPSINESDSENVIHSESNIRKNNDDSELSEELSPANVNKVNELPLELKEDKKTELTPDDSDIATIQAIDSFLEGNDTGISKKDPESSCGIEKSSIENVTKQNVVMSENEDDSMNFEGSSSINERTNAEDVMLGVEGDLDLDNSLTYDSKKLDLSPSSEQSMSGENYDLPGDSYNKESLEKEQENSNLLSDALDDIEESTKESVSDNLTTPKETEAKDQSSPKPTPVIEVGNSDIKGTSQADQRNTETCLINNFKNKESQFSIEANREIGELASETLHEQNLLMSTSNLDENKKLEVKSCDINIDTECTSSLDKKEELFKDESVRLNTSLTKEDFTETSNLHQEKDLKPDALEEVPHAVLSKPTPQTIEGEKLDIENLIPSSTTSANKNLDCRSNKADSCEIEDPAKNTNEESKMEPNEELLNESKVLISGNKVSVCTAKLDTNIQSNKPCDNTIDENVTMNQPVQSDAYGESQDQDTIDESVGLKVPYQSLEDSQPSEASTNTTSKEETTIHVAPAEKQTIETLATVKSPKKIAAYVTESVEEASSDFSKEGGVKLSSESSKEKNESSSAATVKSESSKEAIPLETDSSDLVSQESAEDPSVSEQELKPKLVTPKEIPPPVRVSARQKQRQAAAAAALAAKEKAEPEKSPGQYAIKRYGPQEKQGDKRLKKSLSPTKELSIKISGKTLESGKQSPLPSQKSPKSNESKLNVQISPKIIFKEVPQDKLEPITLKLSKEENPVIVRSSSLSPKKNVSPHSPQGKTLGYTMKIGKDSTTIIPKASTPSPTRRESSPGSSNTKGDLSGKVGYLIKDTGLTITPVAPAESQEQKLNKITLKLSKAGGHPEIKQENKSETWKAIRKLGEIDIVPVEGKSSSETPKRKERSEEGSPEKKIKLGDVSVEPSTSSGVSKLQGLLTQAPLNQSDSSEEGKFIGFGSPTEKLSPAQQSYDIGMIRHDDSPQPPRKRGRPRKITSPDDIVHSVSMQHTLPSGLTAKDILAASLQHQSLQHLHASYQPQQSYQSPEDMDSSQPMVPLFDLFEETFMEPTPPTVFPDQVQPSADIIMRSARGRPIGRSRRPRGSGPMRGHERGGPRGRPRGSRGIKRILEEMEAMSFPDPDQPITLDNIDAEMGPRMPEHAASELTMALLRKSIEGKKEFSEKKARRSDGSEEGNSDLEAKVREMKEKIEAAYQAELKSPGKEGKKRTPEKSGLISKSPPGLIPLYQKQDESVRRKSADGMEVKRKLSEDRREDDQLGSKRKSVDGSNDSAEGNTDGSCKDDSLMEVDQSVMSIEEPNEEEEIKTEPEPPPKPVKPRPKSKAEIKRIKREKDRLRREAKKLAALEALKAPPPNPSEEDTRMSASDPTGDGLDLDGFGIKKNRMEVGDPEGKEFTVEQIAEYQWPLQGGELYMIQEQISTWLGVKSFQRKYPDLKRRRVEMEERTYLCDSGLVSESMCDLGLTAVSSSEVLDIMFQDFPDQYEELRKYMREKQAREVILKQKERKKFEQTLSKSDLKEHAIQSLVSWNSNLNRSRNESRKCHLDLQTWTIQYPKSKAAKMTRPSAKLGSYPVALIPGQYADYYKRYTPQELRYFPVNTVLYGPLQPNEMHSTGGSDGSQSESEDSSSSEGTSDSSSDGEGTEEEEKEKECKTCGSKKTNEAMLQCSQCSHNIHVTCADLNPRMLKHVRKYQWQCSVCKTCQRCNNAKNESKMLFCDLCDRGYHSYCVGLRRVPAGSWTCELCTTSEGAS
ncbi:uncharacterized protein LOC128985543 [Macrosteles quadrilineatus]|uniref:uncharacterized protein LOC128985543 n=1 Tax=Macrosteles quadrilineatus TaxID=74068 RepID=UPI0023E2616F|nr:uncharacterized protein LOC128985543 [Macrosteles quadrilineatus]